MIKISNVSKSYDDGASFVVNNVSLEIQSGETLVIIGSSGSGKTTLLKMINHLTLPTSGRIDIDSTNIADIDPVILRRNIGYVFQKGCLFPHMTVMENVAVVLRLQNVEQKERERRARELLDMVNLPAEEYGERMPDELSGGQQQRIGFARALTNNPNYLLLDEPFGALDSITRDTLQNEFLHLKERLKKTMVFVTHDIAEALRLADRIAVMHQGNLEQVGSKDDILNHPASEFVKAILNTSLEQYQHVGTTE